MTVKATGFVTFVHISCPSLHTAQEVCVHAQAEAPPAAPSGLTGQDALLAQVRAAQEERDTLKQQLARWAPSCGLMLDVPIAHMASVAATAYVAAARPPFICPSTEPLGTPLAQEAMTRQLSRCCLASCLFSWAQPWGLCAG